ncbi:uncharacterized protein LOC119681710 [Teleopsis dalmanni]|uniref:uncharacterized protein LOC119681710 n=1 Tax=Teleopsis dalmanni TaxID=139649 RepID=UPI0018CD1EE2|nr:uncharacterized protein LOC119681710 [Teleopsis dalmanni]
MAKFLKLVTSPNFNEELILGAFRQYYEDPVAVHLVKKDNKEALYLIEFQNQREAQRVLNKLNRRVIRGVLPAHYFTFLKMEVEDTQPPVNGTNVLQQPKFKSIGLFEEECFEIYARFSHSITQPELHSVFAKKFNSIKSVRIVIDRCGVSKGYGFITFSSKVEYQAALNITDGEMQIRNAPICIRNAFPKSGKPYKNRTIKTNVRKLSPKRTDKKRSTNVVNDKSDRDKNLENYLGYGSAKDKGCQSKKKSYKIMREGFRKEIKIWYEQPTTQVKKSASIKTFIDDCFENSENNDQLKQTTDPLKVKKGGLSDKKLETDFGEAGKGSEMCNNFETCINTKSTQTVKFGDIDRLYRDNPLDDESNKLSFCHLCSDMLSLNRDVTSKKSLMEISPDNKMVLYKTVNDAQTGFIERIQHYSGDRTEEKLTLTDVSNQNEFEPKSNVMNDNIFDSNTLDLVSNGRKVELDGEIGIDHLLFIYLIDMALLLLLLIASALSTIC